MRFTFKKKIAAAAVAGAMVIAGGGYAAYAYWLSPGSGSGSAETAGLGHMAITDNSPITPLGPGYPDQHVNVTFTDTGATTYVTNVTITLTGTGSCPAGNYTIDGTPYTVPVTLGIGVEVAQGSPLVETDLYNLGFYDAPSDQSACANHVAALTIGYAST